MRDLLSEYPRPRELAFPRDPVPAPDDRLLTCIAPIFQTLAWNEVLPRVVSSVRQLFAADGASLILPDAEGALRVAYSDVATQEGVAATGELCGDSVAARVAQTGRPMIIVGPLDEHPLFAGLPSRPEVVSSLVQPIMEGTALVGVLTVNRANPVFSAADVAPLEVMASFVRMALCNAALYRRLEQGARDLEEQSRQRERLEEGLRLAQKLEALGQLAAGVAHEINTPIQYVADSVTFLRDASFSLFEVLNLFRQLAEAQPANQERVKEAAEKAELVFLEEEMPKALESALHGTGQLGRIVRALKEFAHPGASELAAGDLNRVLETVLTVSRNEYKYVADLETNLGELPPVMCNVGDLNQVFLNLIVNAAHAISDAIGSSGERGTIRVASWRDGEHAVISISDTGCGIPEAIVKKVWDPFFTTKEVGRGTGQGLAIARKIVVERHQGTITFESTVGKGTTFLIRIPIDGPAAKDAP